MTSSATSPVRVTYALGMAGSFPVARR
jgi:hypothetical protein